MPFLSLIVPFFNSSHKCGPLLTTLRNLDAKDVEVVLIDDGSTDDTPHLLHSFAAASRLPVKVICHDNQGPGGARNSGLRQATGDYVWFVDCDDDIFPQTIDTARSPAAHGYDIIDFCYQKDEQILDGTTLPAGAHTYATSLRQRLLTRFGIVNSKIIRRRLIVDNGLFYPSHCFYEDLPPAFVVPFFVRSLFKIDAASHRNISNADSISRDYGDKYYDRLHTALNGYSRGLTLAQSAMERDLLTTRFVRLFVTNTIGIFAARRSISAAIKACRVMRYYREATARLGAPTNPMPYVMASPKMTVFHQLAYAFSFLLPAQAPYFDDLHFAAWGRRWPVIDS